MKNYRVPVVVFKKKNSTGLGVSFVVAHSVAATAPVGEHCLCCYPRTFIECNDPTMVLATCPELPCN